MDLIDVHDLPEEEAQLVAEFAEFMRQRQWQQTQGKRREKAREVPRHASQTMSFAVWPLGVQGTLGREELYDHL